jgi:hypothetical protein
MKIKIYIFMNVVRAHFLCINSCYEIESVIQVNFIDVRSFHYSCVIIMHIQFYNNTNMRKDVYATELLRICGGLQHSF